MKFDFPTQFVDQVLSVLQEAPVPFKVINPMLQEFLRQANDKKIQSLEYPEITLELEAQKLKDVEEPRLTGESNG